MARSLPLTEKHVDDFLAGLRVGLSVTGAADATGQSRQKFYRRKEDDKAFSQAWDEALEAGTDALEDEARRRGQEGYDEPVFYQGQQVGKVRKYSDTLLIFLLKGRRPEKFRDNHHVHHSGQIGISALLDVIDGASRGLPSDKRDDADSRSVH